MVNCPLCNVHIETDSNINIHNFIPLKLEYKLYHCPNCHLEFWWPFKILFEFYEKYLSEQEISQQGYRSLPPHVKPFFEDLGNKSGILLDIGCGDGVFLKAAENIGWKTTGVDFDRKCISAAKMLRGLRDVYETSLDEFFNDAAGRNIKFDSITFFEVLEHQDDPRGFIAKTCSLLKEGGYIAGSVPNRDRLFVKLERRFINGTRHPEEGDYPPPHLTYWSREVLEQFLREHGFVDIKFYPIGFGSIRELARWFRHIFLGNLLFGVHRKINGEPNKNEPLNKDKESTPDKSSSINTYIQKKLSCLSRMPFLPIAALTFNEFNRRGYQIYFQAKFNG